MFFYKQDETFDLPKAVVMLRFSSDLLRKNIWGLSVAELYLLTVQQLINEFAYDAEVAGLHYGIAANIDSPFSGELGGFELQIAGYNDRIPVLAETLCRSIRQPELKQEAFEVAKAILCRELKILANNKQPYQQATQLRNKFLQTPQYLPQERLAVVENITFEDICNVVESNSLLQGLSVDALIQGNLTENDAKDLLNMIDKTFFEGSSVSTRDSLESSLVPSRVVDLRSGDQLVRLRAHEMAANHEETNNAVVLSIEVGAFSIEEAAFLNLCRAYLHQPFFDTLRTKQQLGYIVACSTSKMLHFSGICFVVQSQWLNPEGIRKRIEAFLEEYVGKPEDNLSDEEFEKLKQATISHLEEKPKRIGDEAHRNFNEVVTRRFQFDRRDKQVAFLRTATRDQFIQFMKVSLYRAPWFNVEISSLKPSDAVDMDASTEKTSALSESIPFEPVVPVVWEDIGNDAEKFLSSRVNFFDFPLPGGQLQC